MCIRDRSTSFHRRAWIWAGLLANLCLHKQAGQLWHKVGFTGRPDMDGGRFLHEIVRLEGCTEVTQFKRSIHIQNAGGEHCGMQQIALRVKATT